MTPPLDILRQSIERAGLSTTIIPDASGNRLVCAKESSAEGLRGNSVWIAFRAGEWYLSTWTPAIYRVPVGCDLASLICDIVASSESVIYRVSKRLIDAYGLVEIDPEEFPE